MQHKQIRKVVVKHMTKISHLLVHFIFPDYSSIKDYIRHTKMYREGTWGTEMEIFTLTHLLNTSVFAYHATGGKWWRYSPAFIDESLKDDDRANAIYISHVHDHFNVVCSVLQ